MPFRTNLFELSVKMLWTKEQIVELIEMLQTCPALWDIRCKQYRDRNIKFDDMSKMASHFKTNVDEINRKIKSLKTQFSRERKKILEKSKSGAGAISHENIWFGYDMMSFLKENNISKGSRTTFEVCVYYYYLLLTYIHKYIILHYINMSFQSNIMQTYFATALFLLQM